MRRVHRALVVLAVCFCTICELKLLAEPRGVLFETKHVRNFSCETRVSFLAKSQSDESAKQLSKYFEPSLSAWKLAANLE